MKERNKGARKDGKREERREKGRKGGRKSRQRNLSRLISPSAQVSTCGIESSLLALWLLFF